MATKSLSPTDRTLISRALPTLRIRKHHAGYRVVASSPDRRSTVGVYPTMAAAERVRARLDRINQGIVFAVPIVCDAVQKLQRAARVPRHEAVSLLIDAAHDAR